MKRELGESEGPAACCVPLAIDDAVCTLALEAEIDNIGSMNFVMRPLMSNVVASGPCGHFVSRRHTSKQRASL